MRRRAAIALVLLLWTLASWLAGPALVPTPWETGREMAVLLAEPASWKHLLITFFRGSLGLAMGAAVALALGIPCGRSRAAMNLMSPIVAAIQACPAIIWISLLMVWVGVGSLVPVVAIGLSAFPALFLNIAQGMASLDPRFFAMARVYRVPRRRVLADIAFQGIASHALAGFAYALGISWKVTATAEFIGSGSGVGSRLYWAYRFLDMPRLFCWAILLVGFGVFVDAALVKPLRRRLAEQKVSSGD